MTNPNVANGLKKLFQSRASFVVVALTGRTGSGCTTVTKLLSQDFEALKAPKPKTEDFSVEDRKYRITFDYAKENWAPFFGISVSNVILSFLLDVEREELKQFLAAHVSFPKPDQIDTFLEEWAAPAEAWKKVKPALIDANASQEQLEQLVESWQNTLSTFFTAMRRGLGAHSIKLLQLIGDNLRKSGNPLVNAADPNAFYVLPERVVSIINAIRKLQTLRKLPTYIVLDALRNPFEVLYFKERFSSFYLIAITTDNSDRERRLAHLGYSPSQISEYDKKEYPEKSKPLSGYEAFTSQNIQSCLEKADIYITNSGLSAPQQQPNLNDLISQLVRYFALMIHPGLVTPTRIERCMQIAFSARANSGCISRQVGAAITDKNDSVKAVGWNDVPAGQVPCLLRRATDLTENADQAAFSDYEFTDKEFRKQVEGSYKRFQLVDIGGRSSSYCFKSEYNTLKGEDNQVHTRSLHAEENAFLQLAKYGGDGIEGGNLYTTASPCELCAKKAFQLGISNIFYIDPYPGISMSHILKAGSKNARPKVELFHGAVGQAYHRLYDPVLPYKDELRALLEGGDEAKQPAKRAKAAGQLF
jgi:deoxycytidylate deaminase